MKNYNASQRGFTIVELLIVIVIIGILAAITIVAYNGIQNRANDTAVKSDIDNFAKKIELAAVDNSGKYPLPPTTLMGIKITKSAYLTNRNNLYYCINATTNQFIITAQSVSGKTFKYISSEGLSEHGANLYGDSSCQLIGQATWSGAGALGFDFAATTWAGWAS